MGISVGSPFLRVPAEGKEQGGVRTALSRRPIRQSRGLVTFLASLSLSLPSLARGGGDGGGGVGRRAKDPAAALGSGARPPPGAREPPCAGHRTAAPALTTRRVTTRRRSPQRWRGKARTSTWSSHGRRLPGYRRPSGDDRS